MGKISLPDFFEFYKGTVEQKEAVVLLESMMPESLLTDDCSWVEKYREQPEVPPSTVPPQCLNIIASLRDLVLFRTYARLVFRQSGTEILSMPMGVKHERRCYPPSLKVNKCLRSLSKEDFWNVLTNTIPFWGEMNANQRSALTSFAFNLGAHFYGASGFSTISACLRDHAWNEVPGAFMLYVNPDHPLKPGCADAAKPKDNTEFVARVMGVS